MKRAWIVSTIRRFLDGRGYLEVETPTCTSRRRRAALARPFETHHNALDLDQAPHRDGAHLKRLVVGGFDRSTRSAASSGTRGSTGGTTPSSPRSSSTRPTPPPRTSCASRGLFHALAVEVTGAPVVTFQGSRSTSRRLTRASRRRGGGARPRARSRMRSRPRARRGAGARGGARERVRGCLEARAGREAVAGEAIAAAFEVFCEPQLPKDRPAFVVDFPLETSPLSRRRDADLRLVDRFELFAGGMECANAFSELNDPADQRARFEAQVNAPPATRRRCPTTRTSCGRSSTVCRRLPARGSASTG